MQDVGFRVSGLGFTDSGLRFRESSSQIRVLGNLTLSEVEGLPGPSNVGSLWVCCTATGMP